MKKTYFTNKKIAGILFILGVTAVGSYLLFAALPQLLVLSSNVFYIVLTFSVLVGFIYLIVKAVRYFFK